MQAIFDFFRTIFQFLSSLFHGIIWAITAVPKFVVLFQQVIVYAPSVFSGMLLLCLTLLVTFMIIRML